MYLLREMLDMSYPFIANKVGKRDHTTVMHGVDKVENQLLEKGFSEEMTRIINFNRGQLVD